MNQSSPSPDSRMRTLALILLPVLGIALVGAAIVVTRASKGKAHITSVVADAQPGTAAINTGEVIDATLPGVALEPRLGYRYKVFVEDESDDRSSGIAKIGGRATFIPDARRGQTALVDVTRVRDRVVDAILVRVLAQVDLPPKPPRLPFSPRPGDPAAHVVPGAEMDVIIAEASSKNPDTEGVAKIAGLVVFVNGVPTIGERVNVRITDRRERLAFAEPTGKPAGTDPLPTYSAPARAPRTFVPRPGDSAAHVVPGAIIATTITEPSEKNPATEGVARVNGLVVFVRGATTIGQAVNVRITERRERIAVGEATTEPVTAPAPTAPAASPAPAPAPTAPAAEPVPAPESPATP